MRQESGTRDHVVIFPIRVFKSILEKIFFKKDEKKSYITTFDY